MNPQSNIQYCTAQAMSKHYCDGSSRRPQLYIYQFLARLINSAIMIPVPYFRLVNSYPFAFKIPSIS